MIDFGDQIKLTATCLNITADEYVFTVLGVPIDIPLTIKRSKTDQAHNQRVDEVLEELKI